MHKGLGKLLYMHACNILDCIRTRELPNADIAIGAEVAKLSHMANISCRVGSALRWDNKTGLFDNEEANLLAKANYRSPWKLPVL